MSKHNYMFLYVTMENYFRSKRGKVVEETPCNWRYRYLPSSIRSIKRFCAYKQCIYCEFLRRNHGDLCIFRYVINPLRDENG